MERETACSPSESAASLLDAIRGMGFTDYGAFSADALARELEARAGAMTREADGLTAALRGVADLTRSILRLTDATHRSYAALKHAPMNISLEAKRAGQMGVPTGVVASNYQMLADELNDVLTSFVVAANDLNESVNRSLFLAGTAALQREMRAAFAAESGADATATRAQDMAILDGQRASYVENARASLQDVLQAKTAFLRSCTAMSRLVSALEVMRVMGKVEWAKVGIASGHMSALLGQFGAFQDEVRGALRQLEALNVTIGARAEDAMQAATGP